MKYLEYNITKPDPVLADFVESFWMLANHAEEAKDTVVMPDGRMDLFFSYSATQPLHATLMGLETEPTQIQFPIKTAIYAVSFKLLAVEYLFATTISDIVNGTRILPDNFWGITRADLNDFSNFTRKASNKIKALIDTNVDSRKKELFDLVYSSNGSLSIKGLSEKIFWGSRQVNRYFQQAFGMPLKTYCNIIRFRASFQHITDGRLFPEQNFTDQVHFIKEIKKYAGVTPKKLAQNNNDRFLQFSALKKE